MGISLFVGLAAVIFAMILGVVAGLVAIAGSSMGALVGGMHAAGGHGMKRLQQAVPA